MRTEKPVGVRFMASLKNEIVENSTYYGWVIARKVSLEGNSVNNDDFTY